MSKIFLFVFYLISSGVLANKDEEDDTASKKVDTSNDPEDQLNGGETIHVPVITMEKVVQAFKYPQNAHHTEQLTIQKLKVNA